jgi:archaellum component FlaF (FlaF/FlaG flagellin family)
MSERVVVLTSSLAAGETSVTFTNNAITPDSIIDINVDTEGVYLENREVSGNTLTITFSEHSDTLGVKVVIRSFHI